jgi:hypothetical protein
VSDQVWDLRNPDGAMTGMAWGRALIAAHDHVLAHSLPERVDVEVRTADGQAVAAGEGLRDESGSMPMSRLDLSGDGRVVRANVWPDESDIGKPVILPGGEVGILLEWWNEPDGSAWRWRVEFSNAREK